MQILEGIVISNKTLKTAIVEVSRRTPHKIYKKLIKRSKKYKVDVNNVSIKLGDRVKIINIRPISKEKHFKILNVISQVQKIQGTKILDSEDLIPKVQKPEILKGKKKI